MTDDPQDKWAMAVTRLIALTRADALRWRGAPDAGYYTAAFHAHDLRLDRAEYGLFTVTVTHRENGAAFVVPVHLATAELASEVRAQEGRLSGIEEWLDSLEREAASL